MDRYSRMIALLKVALPLAALVLLSTVFLLSRGTEQDIAIPFAQKEIEDRMSGQQITAPFFAGSTENGDEILVNAANTRFDNAEAGATAEEMSAIMRLTNGGTITLNAASGNLSLDRDIAQFTGHVVIETNDGLRVETDHLDAHLTTISAQTPGTITATSPLGRLSAGMMSIKTESQGDGVQILFNKGVNLVYDPIKLER